MNQNPNDLGIPDESVSSEDALEAHTQLDLLAAAGPVAEARGNALPTGRPAAAPEDRQRLLDRCRAVIPAGEATDGKIGTLGAQQLKGFDGTGHGRSHRAGEICR